MDTSRALSPGRAGWVSPRPYPEPLWRARQAGRAWGESPSSELGEDGWPGANRLSVPPWTDCSAVADRAFIAGRLQRRSHPLQARYSKNC